jgi:DNA-binding response OmpR family regulator
MHSTTGLNVLVVGDRHGLAESLSPPLRADGHCIGAVADGVQALAVSEARPPDVVFLDADAIGKDAPAVAERLGSLSRRRRPFVIALSDRDLAVYPPESAGSPIDLFLNKSSDLTALRHLLPRFQTVAIDFESFDPMI